MLVRIHSLDWGLILDFTLGKNFPWDWGPVPPQKLNPKTLNETIIWVVQSLLDPLKKSFLIWQLNRNQEEKRATNDRLLDSYLYTALIRKCFHPWYDKCDTQCLSDNLDPRVLFLSSSRKDLSVTVGHVAPIVWELTRISPKGGVVKCKIVTVVGKMQWRKIFGTFFLALHYLAAFYPFFCRRKCFLKL